MIKLVYIDCDNFNNYDFFTRFEKDFKTNTNIVQYTPRFGARITVKESEDILERIIKNKNDDVIIFTVSDIFLQVFNVYVLEKKIDFPFECFELLENFELIKCPVYDVKSDIFVSEFKSACAPIDDYIQRSDAVVWS